MNDLITYLGKPELKATFLVEIGKHEAADQIVQGHYGEMNGKFTGCAIGCSLHSLNVLQGKADPMASVSQHDRVPVELGWPLWLAYLEDNIFERLPDELATTWPRRLAEAIPVGVTVPDAMLAKLLRWTLVGDIFGVVHATDDVKAKAIAQRMGALFAAWDAWAAWPVKAGFYPALSEETLRLLRELRHTLKHGDGH